VSSSPPSPYPGSYWVVPGSLLAGPYPGSNDAAEMKRRLEALLDAGIRSVIYLVDESESEEPDAGDFGDSIEPVQAFTPYEDQLEMLAEARGDLVEIGRYTIDISSAAADQEMELILDAIDAEIEGSNHPTLVHCMNGNGYTGMVAGCYLARHGIAAGKEVLAKIRELRAVDPNLVKAKSPENMIQERFVIRWKQGQ
jgi:hypothetical protein